MRVNDKKGNLIADAGNIIMKKERDKAVSKLSPLASIIAVAKVIAIIAVIVVMKKKTAKALTPCQQMRMMVLLPHLNLSTSTTTKTTTSIIIIIITLLRLQPIISEMIFFHQFMD